MVEEVYKKMEYSDELENNENIKSTSKPGHFPLPCLSSGNRRCMDGSCIASVDLCPEELELNKSTIVIMLVIGLTVLFCLLILYCYKQRSQRRRQETNNNQHFVSENEDISLNIPPPNYDEVVSSNLYPVTPVFQRSMRTSYGEEPRTPPPNYDAALDILAHSSETLMSSKTQPINPVVRRSISTEFNNAGRSLRSAELDFRRVYSNPDQR
ncbi:hypothetical protein Bpfe_007894 [Biomphalaria pfeifferi]|uniref:Uncharacterized protein n=1 Tax=Biomphalaria pfeifferi TaxID=112525 RepID=A0AAD8FGV8_BIOPF|nr:hypothetical protein Bpfe_007894 [Biomphalaria pfeifferi]